MIASALVALVAPAAAQAVAQPAAAQAVGPATFVQATGGSTTLSLLPGGLTTYAASPAYIAVRAGKSTVTLENYAAHHVFAAVAVRDSRAGNAGIDCFYDAQLVTGRSYINDFVRGGLEYHGLLMQYASFSFKRGATSASACSVTRSPGPAVTRIVLGKGSPKLVIDCLIRVCRGSFVTFGRQRGCTSTTPIPGGGNGCLPTFRGTFTMSGGLTLTFTMNLLKRSASSTFISLSVNGKVTLVSRLTSLPQPRPTPPRPQKSTISAACTSAAAGSPVTVSGALKPAGRGAVVLTFTSPTGAVSTVTSTAGSSGSYSARFTPASAGNWTVTADFNGDRSRRASTSSTCRFTVT